VVDTRTSDLATTWSALNKANTYQIRFDHRFNSVWLLTNGNGQSAQSYRLGAELGGEQLEKLPVNSIQSPGVNLKKVHRTFNGGRINTGMLIYGCEVSNSTQ
jgi:hypothetical protein